MDATASEEDTFNELQRYFATPTLLVHFNADSQLYNGIDASKIAFGAMVFHAKDNLSLLGTSTVSEG